MLRDKSARPRGDALLLRAELLHGATATPADPSVPWPPELAEEIVRFAQEHHCPQIVMGPPKGGGPAST